MEQNGPTAGPPTSKKENPPPWTTSLCGRDEGLVTPDCIALSVPVSLAPHVQADGRAAPLLAVLQFPLCVLFLRIKLRFAKRSSGGRDMVSERA